MGFVDIYTALATAAKNALGNIPIESENQPEKKTATGGETPEKSAVFSFLPNTPDPFTLGNSGSDLATGIFQVTMRYKKGTGIKPSATDADTLRTVFYAGALLSSGGQTVTIRACGPSPGYNSVAYFEVPISIEWAAQINR